MDRPNPMTGLPNSEPRYALYFTPPPGHLLTLAGDRWLRRGDSDLGLIMGMKAAKSHQLLIEEPRRYGFHATLKAPFRLNPRKSRSELILAIAEFSRLQRPCPVGPLRIARLGNTFALKPRSPTPFARSFASRVVSTFDRFRAPLDSWELKRRMQAPLDDVETTHLVTWGYPYVFERFDFHMTLTGAVDATEHDQVQRCLEAVFGPTLDDDFAIDAITLCEQENPDSDFVSVKRFQFNAPPIEFTSNGAEADNALRSRLPTWVRDRYLRQEAHR